MQRYRSGHNEAVLKTVWVNARVGSNPTLCAMSARLFGLADDFLIQYFCHRVENVLHSLVYH